MPTSITSPILCCDPFSFIKSTINFFVKWFVIFFYVSNISHASYFLYILFLKSLCVFSFVSLCHHLCQKKMYVNANEYAYTLKKTYVFIKNSLCAFCTILIIQQYKKCFLFSTKFDVFQWNWLFLLTPSHNIEMWCRFWELQIENDGRNIRSATKQASILLN